MTGVKPTIAIGVRFCSEIKDKFAGEVAAMLMPHSSRDQLQDPGPLLGDFWICQVPLGLAELFGWLIMDDRLYCSPW